MDTTAQLTNANQTLKTELAECRQSASVLRSDLDLCTAILNTVSTLVVVIDTEGYIIRCNHAFEQVTGYAFNELRNHPVWELFLTQDESESLKAVLEQIQVDQLAIAHENNWLTKDGSRPRIAWSYTPFFDTDGTVKYIISTGIDITDRNQAELTAHLEKQAAILLERERAALGRVAEIAKANDALKAALAALAIEPELEKFLSHVLSEITRTAGAWASHLLLYNVQANTLQQHIAVQGGVTYLGTAPNDPPMFYKPFSADITGGWQYLLATRQLVLSDIDEHNDLMWPETISWHQAQGHLAHASVALIAGNQPVGLLCLAFRDKTTLTSEQIELLQALANQATLAIQMTRLAEAAKQSAIATEQEKAAQEQVAKLVKANEALKKNLDSLATQPELDGFLGQVISETVAQTGAAEGYLFLYNQESHSLLLHLVATEGESLVNWRERQDMEVFSRPIPADVTPGWELLVRTRTPVIFDLSMNSDLYWPGTQDWHQRRGHTRSLCVTLMLGERPLGILGLAFTKQTTFTAEEVELAHALTQQATLAIELTRLANCASQSAVFCERNRMAREIHDTLAQALTGIIIHLEAAQEAVAMEPDIADHLTRASTLARNGLSEARLSVQALRPEVLETNDLPTTLRRITQQMSEGTAIQTEVCVEGIPSPLPKEVELNLMRIGQEALTNALKYAQAQTIRLELRYEVEVVHLRIVDDGQGFEPHARLDTNGFGLIGMQERTELMGGTLTITSQLGQGTEICVRVPV